MTHFTTHPVIHDIRITVATFSNWLESLVKFGRGEWIRTTDPLLPNYRVASDTISVTTGFLPFFRLLENGWNNELYISRG